jgi:hypothetical protein
MGMRHLTGAVRGLARLSVSPSLPPKVAYFPFAYCFPPPGPLAPFPSALKDEFASDSVDGLGPIHSTIAASYVA